MKCKYCEAEIRQEVCPPKVEGDVVQVVWVDHTEGDTCEHWDGEQGMHDPEPDEIPGNAPELIGLFDQGDKFETDPAVLFLTEHGQKCIDEWSMRFGWGDPVPTEFVGAPIYKALKRIDRMTRPWAPTRVEAPTVGRVLGNGALVVLVRSLPYLADGAAPGCIVLCRFRDEYVTWFYNEQDLGCHYGFYCGDDLHAAVLNFLERT